MGGRVAWFVMGAPCTSRRVDAVSAALCGADEPGARGEVVSVYMCAG